METVLVAAERTRCDEIKRKLSVGGYTLIRAESEKEARVKILDFQFSLVIVDSPLPSGSARETAVFAAANEIDTVLLVPAGLAAHMADAMLRSGVYVSTIDELGTTLRAVRVSREKIRKLDEKTRKLLERLRNERVLSEAKCLLANKKAMSEKEAHSYIEKKAKDCRISLSDAAMSIVRELS